MQRLPRQARTSLAMAYAFVILCSCSLLMFVEIRLNVGLLWTIVLSILNGCWIAVWFGKLLFRTRARYYGMPASKPKWPS